MSGNKKSLIKTLTWEIFHLVGVAGVIYVFTGEWEYASLGAIAYILWESVGYYVHERMWEKYGKK